MITTVLIFYSNCYGDVNTDSIYLSGGRNIAGL